MSVNVISCHIHRPIGISVRRGKGYAYRLRGIFTVLCDVIAAEHYGRIVKDDTTLPTQFLNLVIRPGFLNSENQEIELNGETAGGKS